MSRVHQLGRLDRAGLIVEWMAACKVGDGRIAREVAATATRDQLIAQIVTAEEVAHDAEWDRRYAEIRRAGY